MLQNQNANLRSLKENYQSEVSDQHQNKSSVTSRVDEITKQLEAATNECNFYKRESDA